MGKCDYQHEHWATLGGIALDKSPLRPNRYIFIYTKSNYMHIKRGNHDVTKE